MLKLIQFKSPSARKVSLFPKSSHKARPIPDKKRPYAYTHVACIQYLPSTSRCALEPFIGDHSPCHPSWKRENPALISPVSYSSSLATFERKRAGFLYYPVNDLSHQSTEFLPSRCLGSVGEFPFHLHSRDCFPARSDPPAYFSDLI